MEKGGLHVQGSLLALGSMGGIDLYLVVEKGDEEEEEVEEEKITDEKSTRSVWGAEEEKENGARVYDIRMRDGILC